MHQLGLNTATANYVVKQKLMIYSWPQSLVSIVVHHQTFFHQPSLEHLRQYTMTSTILHNLIPRGLLSDSDSDDQECRSWDEDNQADPISGDLTFHQLITYISAGCMALTFITTFIIMAGHVFRYRNPRIQKQLVRMIFLIPVFAVFSFIGVVSYRATEYMLLFAKLYEAFALIAVFYLMIALLTPNATTWAEEFAFFAQPEHMGFKRFRLTYLAVMQLLPGRIITTIAAILVTAIDCYGAENYKKAHLAINIINAAQTLLLISFLIRFLKRWAPELKKVDSRIVGKLACFKLVVIFEVLETLVFSILSKAGVLDPTATLSYNDLHLGISTMIITVVVTFLGLGMVFFFSHGQFRGRRHDSVEDGKPVDHKMPVGHKKMNPIHAIFNVLDMRDIIVGMVRAVKLLLKKEPRIESYAGPAPAYSLVNQEGYAPPSPPRTAYQGYGTPSQAL